MKLSDQLEIDSQNFVKEMYQTPIFRNHIWYPSIFINKSYLPFRPTEGNLQNHTSYIYIYWNTVKGCQTASTHRKTIVAWLPHKAVNVKQEVGIWRVQKRFPRYGVPIWSLWPNIRSLPSIVAEKNVTKNVHICSMWQGR
jgi:hypothetical protein